ncbi:secretion protein XcpP [Pseudomonas sp. REST10]|nr:secretion protein XcpP [Pseudomonas sp. REST10]
MNRYRTLMPPLLGLLALILVSSALAWQSADLLRLVRGQVQPAPEQAGSGQVQHGQAPVGQLFGAPRQADSGPAPTTNLQLTLLGSFVHSDPQRSSALIQPQGEHAQRFAVGTEVSDGVRVDAIYADRVELLRNGRRESLGFPRQQSGQYSYTPPFEATQEDPQQQLERLDQDNLEQLRQRMQMLREQMEASGTLPEETPPDQPMESD